MINFKRAAFLILLAITISCSDNAEPTNTPENLQNGYWFWYEGPEFPYFQNLVHKYNEDELAKMLLHRSDSCIILNVNVEYYIEGDIIYNVTEDWRVQYNIDGDSLQLTYLDWNPRKSDRIRNFVRWKEWDYIDCE